ncbi:MAG: hypothetical protein IH608_11285 [Proteobacteria bacterium]|nr:hypothetical protein [Pseudomonadota bacterium]
MAPLATLTTIETLYARVLELTRDQEHSLRGGDLADLQSLLLAKDAALAEAQRLLGHFKAEGGDPASSVARETLGRIGVLLRELVAAEERCRALAPSGAVAPSPRQVAAAYGTPRR